MSCYNCNFYYEKENKCNFGHIHVPKINCNDISYRKMILEDYPNKEFYIKKKAEPSECKGCDYNYSTDCSEGCLKLKYYAEQEKNEKQ